MQKAEQSVSESKGEVGFLENILSNIRKSCDVDLVGVRKSEHLYDPQNGIWDETIDIVVAPKKKILHISKLNETLGGISFENECAGKTFFSKHTGGLKCGYKVYDQSYCLEESEIRCAVYIRLYPSLKLAEAVMAGIVTLDSVSCEDIRFLH